MASTHSFLRLPGDLFDPAAVRIRSPGRITNIRHLCIHSNIFKTLFAQASANVANEDKREIIDSVVGVLDKIQSIGRLVANLAEDPIDPHLMEAFLGLLRNARIRELHIVEHDSHEDGATTEPELPFSRRNPRRKPAVSRRLQERNAQLVRLGEAIRQNGNIQKVRVWNGAGVLSSLGPTQSLQQLDVSLVNEQITQTLIEVLPRITSLEKLVLHANEVVGPPPRAGEWKARLMKAIQKSPNLKEVKTEGGVPLFDDNDHSRIARCIRRNEHIARLQTGSGQPISQSLLPNVAARIQSLSTRHDVIFDLLAGDAACHQHLLVTGYGRRKRPEPTQDGSQCEPPSKKPRNIQ